jgi:inosine-uridine nucleoside N-ribohydrolase
MKATMGSKLLHKVIFDTDPGVDDAMALYYALAHPAIEIVGITTTFGNVFVQQAATNALYLTALSGHNIPTTQGIAKPLFKHAEAPPDFIHGADGLGNLPQRKPHSKTLDPRSSAQFIVDMARAHPGEITLVPVGPLGNLAEALALEPALPTLVREVILMGGTVLEPGNVSPVAEANIWNDPHAADKVFTAGWKLTMVGLDVTHQVILPVTLFERIAQHHQHPATDTLLHAVRFYANFYSNLHPRVAKVHGCFGHDVLAFVALTNPELFGLETGPIRVAVDGLAQGQTILSRRPPEGYPQEGWGASVPASHACLQVDAAAACQLVEDTLMRDWLKA